jgi:tetratricopeptide (TPR) repeat protein
MRGLRTLSLLVALVFAATSAHAKGRVDAEAKVHTQKGYALYRAGQYLEASTEFEAAYSTLPDGGLLYNAAQAARLGGDRKRARTLYSSYVSFHPDEKNVADAKTHLEELDQQIAIEEASQKPEVVVVQQAPPPKRERHTPPILKKWWFWTAIAGGVVVVAGAAVLGVELSKTPRWSNTNDIGPGATPQSLTIRF